MCRRRNDYRNAGEKKAADKEFVDTTWSDDEKVNHVRERWLREFREEK